ncbi:CopG family transcriptional regulator [Lichenihabitans sp. Uapishka_5]|uniref:CopG family ribbon-helix-helix protein n=1 Tax=Lichenihabitans sp. Uapishka_5 TaxID=3037302 RepID=UPI0029E81334|nr:CopG family transcriptional regulator [Lichenihabitans sp. Uapishka_5]MDX7952661.1 CopG family transcriptional regulator [Lichenihabitans sp. Uapishka_5]
MPDSTTLTVRLSADTKAQLARLAGSTRRTEGVLGAEAIAAYVQRELAIVGAIEHGRADVAADRVTDHAEVMRQARAVLEAARTAG